MEWAEQTNQDDALLSLFIGLNPCWSSAGGSAWSWLDRVPEPPASDPNLRSQWIATSGVIRIVIGDEATGYGRLFEAAAIVDELIATDSNVRLSQPSFSALIYRGVVLAFSTPLSASLAESDRLRELQVDGEPRHAEWISLSLRTFALMFAGDDAALTSVIQTEAVGRTISRQIYENSVATKAILMSRAGRYDEAVAAAMQCFDSQVLGPTNKLDSLVPAATSLAALGRFDEALEVVERDFGPLISSQRTRLLGSQLASLLLILHHLECHDRVNELIAIGYAFGHDLMGFDQAALAYFGDVLGGEDGLAALPTPDPAELTPDRIASLVDDLITETRELIA